MEMRYKRRFILLFIFLSFLAACNKENEKTEKPTEENLGYTKTDMDDLKDKNDPYSKSVKRGYELMNDTSVLLDEYVGNKLSCSSCHGNAGLDSTSSFIGVTAVYPQYNARAGKVFTIEDRINGCFNRSMNGKPLPYNSDEMRAMVSYLTYISRGVPTSIKERKWMEKNRIEKLPEANAANGEKLYKQSCVTCHGQNGEGSGATTGPALWGDNSFNNGAGMARPGTMAGYIKRNMPPVEMGGLNKGEITEQQAADLAAFILSQPRPDFAKKANDWPNGDAPDDVPYSTNSKKVKEESPQGAEGEKKK
jgi:thiosulfate dehydrogenase